MAHTEARLPCGPCTGERSVAFSFGRRRPVMGSSRPAISTFQQFLALPFLRFLYKTNFSQCPDIRTLWWNEARWGLSYKKQRHFFIPADKGNEREEQGLSDAPIRGENGAVWPEHGGRERGHARRRLPQQHLGGRGAGRRARRTTHTRPSPVGSSGKNAVAFTSAHQFGRAMAVGRAATAEVGIGGFGSCITRGG